MASAGNKNHYEVVKPDGTKAQYVRVTHVIQETLAKQALVGWAYRHTRDTIAGLVAVLIDAGVPWVDILDVLNDADLLEEYLKENQLRPDDIKEEAGELGTENHAAFERLGRLYEQAGPGFALATAHDYQYNSTDGHARAIGGWWAETQPEVVAAEVELTSHEHEFKGTCDLIWRDAAGELVITDLKNRGADKPCGVNHKTEAAAEACHATGGPWESDYVQVGAYDLALREQEGMVATRKTVLIAQADGRYRERESELDSSIFLDLLNVYRKLRGGA